jgi:hypothetical protein
VLKLKHLDEALALTDEQIKLVRTKLKQMTQLKSELEQRAARYTKTKQELLATRLEGAVHGS